MCSRGAAQVFNRSRAELYEVSAGQFTKLTDVKGQSTHMALHREARGLTDPRHLEAAYALVDQSLVR